MNTVHFIAHYEKKYNNKDREIKMCVIKVAFLHKSEYKTSMVILVCQKTNGKQNTSKKKSRQLITLT